MELKQYSSKRFISIVWVLCLCVLCFSFLDEVRAEEESKKVELNGDVMEYSVDGNVITAIGDVSIKREDLTLYCDKVEFYRDKQMAYAEGNVRLVTADGEISGDEIVFDFETMQGGFHNSRITADPYFGMGEKIVKVGENRFDMDQGYLTTCDHDKPHYRFGSKKLEIYPGEKIVTRNVRLLLGQVPIFYIPKYVQSLKEDRPRVTVTPGNSSEWGAYLLLGWRYYFSENFKGRIHTDYREKLDFASGFDLSYNTPKTGSGLIRTYYTNERIITSDGLFRERLTPTQERERFKVEWRHKWDIDEKTNAILQYYRLSDAEFLKDFFERESEEDSSPRTFFLLTRTLSNATLSFRTDARVNRFNTEVERLPEVSYDLAGLPLGETGLFFNNTTSFANLGRKFASPSNINQNTVRFDTDNEISYPMKVGIIEFKPFVGGRNTYYSKTNDPEKYDSIRGIFETGASLSTKFYRIFNVQTERFGLDVNQLRHIVTPSINYQFANDPTISASQLDNFDTVDTLTSAHKINFSLENKLQTKRDGKSVDLLRFIVETNYRLKENPSDVGFDFITTDLDFRPTSWLTLFADSQYDLKKDHLDTANFDLQINAGKKWQFDLSKRLERNVDDIITAGLEYTLNSKWKVRMYERVDVLNGMQQEQQYTITRDLHAWEMDISFNETRGEGSEVMVVFRIKAFPDASLDAGTSFNRRKSGSQGQ